MKYLYGPVKSRRLGNSLGISLTPHKFCSFDCIYCQLGPTTNKVVARNEYVNTRDILLELKEFLNNHSLELINLNFISLSGLGEPTLNSNIGDLINEIKQLSNVPLAVITNSSLLSSPDLRKELLGAGLIIPSLDAVTDDVFERIDRPDNRIKIKDIIEGLVSLRREFKGKIWLEIMLVKGINDDLRYIRKIKETTDKIMPDKIQINSPVRFTTEVCIAAVDGRKLKRIKEVFGDMCEII